MSPALPIAIFGATGVTGGFAFDAAEARGLAPIAIGRNQRSLEAFLGARSLGRERMRLADAHEPRALNAALDGVSVVISTVAPFSEHGFPVARAAAELGLGYTDSTGEAGFMQRLLDELDPIALRSGASLCTGNGVTAFLGDIAMHWITDRDANSSGALLYELRHYRPSFGTLLSYLKHILPGGGACIRDARVVFKPFASFSGAVSGIGGFQAVLPDALVISRYWPARRLDTLIKGPSFAQPVVAGLVWLLLRPAVRDALLRLPLQRWTVFDPVQDGRSFVTALAEFQPVGGQPRYRKLRAQAIYSATGDVLAATAQAMQRRHPRPAGVRAASEMFESFEEAVRQAGVEDVFLTLPHHDNKKTT